MRSPLPLAIILALPLACVTDLGPGEAPELRGEHAADAGQNQLVEAVAPPAKPDELRVLKIIGHADTVTAAAFFSGGSRLLTGSADASLRLWDGSSGRELARFKSHTLPVVAIAATADGQLFASSGKDQVTRIWDAASGKELRHVGGLARVLAFSPDFKLLAAGLDDHSVRVFEVETGTPRGTLKGHRRAVVRLAFDPTGETLVSADEEGAIIAWSMASGQALRAAKPLGHAVRGLAFDRAGRRLAATTADRHAYVLEAATLQPLLGLTLPAEAGAAAFTRAGDYLLVAGGTKLFEPDAKKEDYSVRLFALASGRLAAVFAGHTAPVLAIAQAESEGDAVVTASADETVRLWPAPEALAAAQGINH